MLYPFKYPEVYAELARQGKQKQELAKMLGITCAGLRHKQSLETTADFGGEEMKKISQYLDTPADYLFGLSAHRSHTPNQAS